MKDNPLVSVVIPCFNCSDTIERTVLSVFNQTYKNIEIILVSGKDNNPKTRPAMEKAASCFPIDRKRLIFLDTNLGPGNNRDVGIAAAKGNYIALLDADDSFLPSKIETDLKYISTLNCDGVCSFLKNQSEFNSKKYSQPQKLTLSMELKKNRVHVSTLLVKNEKWFHFDQRITLYAEDIFLWLELLADGHSIFRYPEITVDNGVSPNQITSRHQKDMYQARLKMYHYLRDDKRISWFQLKKQLFIEYLKHIRRKIKRSE